MIQNYRILKKKSWSNKARKQTDIDVNKLRNVYKKREGVENSPERKIKNKKKERKRRERNGY
jgi:hypothetical protein